MNLNHIIYFHVSNVKFKISFESIFLESNNTRETIKKE